MKISEIKTFPVVVGTRNQMLVKIETEEGIYGWGESGLVARELAVQGAVQHYREFLLGKNPMQRGRIWQEMYRSQYFEGGRVLTAAISAIDIALHDIVGKKLGIPVYELLGGKQREWVPTFATGNGNNTDEVVAMGQLLWNSGFKAFRLQYQHFTEDLLFEPRVALAATATALNAAREALGPEPVIGIDIHHRYSVAEAASFCNKLRPDTLDFVEEPIRDETPEAYAELRKMTNIPFAIGEEFASKWQFLPYIERGLTNFARLDICNVGGFTEAMKVAGWAEAHYIDLMPHNPLGPICVAATSHMAMAIPNFSWLEISEAPGKYDPTVFPSQPKIEPGMVTVLNQPGLGIEVDESLLNEPFIFSEPPHLHRTDGSHTNR